MSEINVWDKEITVEGTSYPVKIWEVEESVGDFNQTKKIKCYRGRVSVAYKDEGKTPEQINYEGETVQQVLNGIKSKVQKFIKSQE